MAASDATSLDIQPRPVEGSRAARRLRRSGLVPGVIYGGADADSLPFSVDARILRNTLAHAHAVIQLTLDGGGGQPVILKDLQRHPVRGEIQHVDFLRVRMDETIHSTVTLELVGADVAPGVIAGGILSQEVRELAIEALPGDIPDSITLDVSSLELNATLTAAAITPPRGVTVLGDAEEIVIATITPPTLEPTEDEIETETQVIGAPAGAASGDTAPEADAG